MNAIRQAQQAYAPTSGPMRSMRSTEYEVIARITHRIKAAAQKGKSGVPELAAALHENRQLWTVLATDVADPDNALPSDLRARIFYLAEFTHHHTSLVLSKEAGVAPLLEINTAILRGLKSGGSQS